MTAVGMMISAIGNKRRAFTLVEALVVVMLVGVMAGLAVPSFSRAFEGIELNAAAGEFQAFLNYFRQRAIVENRVIEVVVDVHDGKFWAKYAHDPSIIKNGVFPRRVSVSADNDTVRFYPNGTADRMSLALGQKNGGSVIIATQGGYGRVKATVQE
jgi:type II secretion system protein H